MIGGLHRGRLLAEDPGPELSAGLHRLTDRLTDVGFTRTQLLPLRRSPADLVSDPLNAARFLQGRSNIFEPSAAGARLAVLGRVGRSAVGAYELLTEGRALTFRRCGGLLGPPLLADLIDLDVLRPADGRLRSALLAAPYEGRVYFSDPFADQDEPDYCYLGRTTFTPPSYVISRLVGSVGSGRLLDLGCGAGVGALALADHFAGVVGTDVVDRCLRFSRLNAGVQEVRNASFDRSDLFSDVTGTFDVIITNTPCVWAEGEPGIPRTYANGGRDFGLELPLRMIRGALGRLRPGGAVVAVVTAPVRNGRPTIAAAMARACGERPARILIHPLLEEYEWRNAGLYRRHRIAAMVRYLVELRPDSEPGQSCAVWDGARLRSSQLRSRPVRWAARVSRR